MTKENDNIVELVKKACDLALGIHNHMRKVYLPKYPKDGIHEYNFVSHFIEAVKQKSEFKNVSAWTEMRIYEDSKERLDAAIKLTDEDIDKDEGKDKCKNEGKDKNSSILIVEAKKIRRGKTRGKFNSIKAHNAILKDAKRLQNMNANNTPIIPKSGCHNVYRVLLASVWYTNIDIETQTDETRHLIEARDQWMNRKIFGDGWSNCAVYETDINKEDREDIEKYTKLLVAIDGPYTVADMPNSSTEQTEQ